MVTYNAHFIIEVPLSYLTVYVDSYKLYFEIIIKLQVKHGCKQWKNNGERSTLSSSHLTFLALSLKWNGGYVF